MTKWDENLINELRQFHFGVRIGWLQSSLINDEEHKKMVKEIDLEIALRIKVIFKV